MELRDIANVILGALYASCWWAFAWWGNWCFGIIGIVLGVIGIVSLIACGYDN